VWIPSNILVLSYLQTSPGQVESVCTKARKLFGLLYRRFHNNTGTNTLLELYTTLVRPHLEYAAPFGILLQPITLANWKILRSSLENLYQAVEYGLSGPSQINQFRIVIYTLKCVHFMIIVHNLIYFPSNILPNTTLLYLHPYFTNLLHEPMHSVHLLSCQLNPYVWNNLPQEANFQYVYP